MQSKKSLTITVASLLALSCLLALPAAALAGGGAQNVLVVVNPNSWASMTVANEFIHARNIPDSNVLFLPFTLDRKDDTIDLDTFRTKILQPVLAAIKDRGLEGQINTVAYSSDFPTAIDTGTEGYKNIAAINGLTYLYEAVQKKDARKYLELTQSNRYFRHEEASKAFAVGPWDETGKLSRGSSGDKYLQSIVLGVTSGRGNSVSEVVAGLRRAAGADGTRPKGMFYFMTDGSIRTEIRKPLFGTAIDKLGSLGYRGEVLKSPIPEKAKMIAMPEGKDDVLGALIGQQWPNPAKSGSKCLPGAIVDNLTSEGGIMDWSSSQAPLSEFIRFGSAGSSGTVIEPGGTQLKFATPLLFVHYAAGCSLIESYYQSVQGPFQLLIVGDPLCQPFARIPKVSVESPTAGKTVVGKLTVKASAQAAAGAPGIAKMELLVDGKRVGNVKAGDSVDLDTTILGDGYHEVRVVAISEGDIATQGCAIVPITVNNHDQNCTLSAAAKTAVYGSKIKLTAQAKGAAKIDICHAGRAVTAIDGEGGSIEIDTRDLGMETVRLSAVALVGESRVASAPLEIQITAPKALPALTVDAATLKPGALLTGKDIQPYVIAESRKTSSLHKSGVKVNQPWLIEGYIEVPKEDVYQVQVWFSGKMTVRMDDQSLTLPEGKDWRFVPVALAAGMHKLTVEGEATSSREMDIRFGGPGSAYLGASYVWRGFDAKPFFMHVEPK